MSTSPPFVDGSRDFNIDADEKTRRIRLLFDGETEASIAPLDTHNWDAVYSEDNGSAYNFNFTTRTGEVIRMRYAPGGYKRSQTKTYTQRREVELIHYP